MPIDGGFDQPQGLKLDTDDGRDNTLDQLLNAYKSDPEKGKLFLIQAFGRLLEELQGKTSLKLIREEPKLFNLGTKRSIVDTPLQAISTGIPVINTSGVILQLEGGEYNGISLIADDRINRELLGKYFIPHEVPAYTLVGIIHNNEGHYKIDCATENAGRGILVPQKVGNEWQSQSSLPLSEEEFYILTRAYSTVRSVIHDEKTALAERANGLTQTLVNQVAADHRPTLQTLVA